MLPGCTLAGLGGRFLECALCGWSDQRTRTRTSFIHLYVEDVSRKHCAFRSMRFLLFHRSEAMISRKSGDSNVSRCFVHGIMCLP